MASYTIPEDVIGVPLFVPSAYDFFSIETAGMPNGDNCLKIHGATSSDYKAFLPAQVVSPPLFTNRTAAVGQNWSMVYWFKGPSAAPSTSKGIGTLFSPMNASCNAPTLGTDNNYVWHSHIYLQGGVPNMGFARAANVTNWAYAANTWFMVTVVVQGSNTNVYINDALTNISASSAAISTTLNGNNFFCIGSYSDQGTMNGWNQDWYLGKLSFHDHALNSTERALLYQAMI